MTYFKVQQRSVHDIHFKVQQGNGRDIFSGFSLQFSKETEKITHSSESEVGSRKGNRSKHFRT